MRRLATIFVLATATYGCRDTVLVPPRSLDSPTAVAVARGKVCVSTYEDSERVVQYEIGGCADGEFGAIGLIVNEQSDRVALMDLSSDPPRLVDLDPSTPGPSHLEVGRLPVDVATSPDGTVAYTLNQLDRDVSVIDLWTPEVLPARLAIDDTPIALDVDPVSGEVVVAAGSPSRIYAFQGVSYCGPGEPCAGSPAVTDIEPQTLDLPGTVSDFVFAPGGDEAWFVYRDLEYASVVSFGPTPDGFDTPCLSGVDQKPCVTAQVSLGYGCSDGLDNDGDGLVDQQDPQCFGPRGAESPEGLGRVATDACANGIDDDMDGLTDRDDPECALASGVDEATGPFVAETPIVACNDTVDTDGDGNVDFPSDRGCYGPYGRTEVELDAVGFDAIGVDSHGVFGYVADRSGEQILVLDIARKRLIDAPAATSPGTDAFDSAFGIDVAPSPLSVQGSIDRTVVWVDPDDENHVIVQYDFGAWLSANNGSLQYVDSVVSFCEFTGEVVARDAFWRGEQGPEESKCLAQPQFPMASATARVVAADSTLPTACTEADFVECATCLEAGEALCESCLLYGETQFDLCKRAFVDEVTSYVNPRFALRDEGGEDGRLIGNGTCEQPDELLEAMQSHAQDNPTGPQDLRCNSLLMPQPLEPLARTFPVDDTSNLSELGRASLVELRTLRFDTDAGNAPLVGFRPSDQRILNEAVTTTFEGILPGTQRADGLFDVDAQDDGSVWLNVGFDPCARGVVPGDHLIVTSEARSSCGASGAFEYEIVETTGSEVRIAPTAGGADEVPVRGCFDTAVAYEVRSHDEWVVVGDTVGFLSPLQSALGRCVDRYGADRISSRVRTGELYEGPYYSFYLYPGVAAEDVVPVRDTSVTFQVTSGFASRLFPTCSSLGTQCAPGLFPTQVLWAPGLPNGTRLIAPDPNDNFIHVRNLDDPLATYTVVR